MALRSEPVQVTPARIEDAAQVAAIHVAAWQVAYQGIFSEDYLGGLPVAPRESYWREAISTGASQLLVAKRNSSIVGWVDFGASRDPDAPARSAEIHAIYVHPQHWSTGVGTPLWLRAKANLLEAGYQSISLWVLAKNSRAITFYRRAGFLPDSASAQVIVRGGRSAQEIRYICHV
jgi:ribosomal protein S18 acetylase RimI-like enzyme